MRRSERPLSKSCCTALILRAGAQVGREFLFGSARRAPAGGRHLPRQLCKLVRTPEVTLSNGAELVRQRGPLLAR